MDTVCQVNNSLANYHGGLCAQAPTDVKPLKKSVCITPTEYFLLINPIADTKGPYKGCVNLSS